MSLLDIILIAIALAMDCFAVSVAAGVSVRKFQWKWALRMAFFFGLFQGLMPLIGYLLGFHFKLHIEACDHWIALFILCILGVKMIFGSLKKNEGEKKSISPLVLSSVLLMAIATSIDALVTGVIFIPHSQIFVWAIVIIGFVSFFFSLIGSYTGVYLTHKFKLNFELIGGVILIGIGVKIFLEHNPFGTRL